MQMNQPVWFVEDRKLMTNDEGKKKLQEVADANSKSQSRLTIVHGADFDKARQLSLSCMLALRGVVLVTCRSKQKGQTTAATNDSAAPLLCGCTSVQCHCICNECFPLLFCSCCCEHFFISFHV